MADDLPTEPSEWDQYIGPNGRPRIMITPPSQVPVEDDPYARAAERVRRSVKGRQQLPIEGQPVAPETPPSYLMAPDLLDTQQGQQSLPTGVAVNDAGIPFNIQTGAEIPTVQRPNVLPIAKTPDGYTLAMPKMLDLASNVMGGVAGVPAKAGEVVLGSGAVRKMAEEAPTVAAPFFSALESAVDNAKLSKGSADQWLGYLKNQPGVKSEELSTVLGDLKGNLTKSEVQNAVKNNKVELGEKVKGELPDSEILKQSKIKQEDWDKMTQSQKELIRTGFPVNPTKYHSYQLPGGENYKEMLLTLPEKHPDAFKERESFITDLKNKYGDDGWFANATETEKTKYEKMQDNYFKAKDSDEYFNRPAPFKSSHWDEPNIIAHIRHNDRMVEGKKTLHLEEVQSDWGQLIRKQGYKLDPKEKEALDASAKSVDDKLIKAGRDDIMGNPDLKVGLDKAVKDKLITDKEAKDYLKLTENENSTTPDMPFKKNWDELALKRMLHKAATEGYHGLSWTPGEAQAARYDLSKTIDNIAYNPNTGYFKAIDKTGKDISTGPVPKEKLADTIGKEAADKLLKTEPNNVGIHSLQNADLKIGGEGMKTFYDKMLVDRANSLVKKYGSKVESKEIEGIPNHIGHAKRGEPEYLKQSIHYLPITEELRAKAKSGFPLFSSTPILTPVNHDPFNSDKKFKLTPVPHNPFNGN